MRKKLVLLIGCCTALFSTACVQGTNDERGKMDMKIQIIDTENETKEKDMENCILAVNCQKNAFCLGEFTYIAINQGLYMVGEKNQTEQLCVCTEAVGTLGKNGLYWAVRNAGNNIQIIKINEQGEISEVGVIEESQPISALDFYEDVIYLRFKLGNVVGYRIGLDDTLLEPASVEEMQLYKEENLASDIRMNNPDDKGAIQAYPYHIVGAGYTKTVTGQEFLARHIQVGDIGHEEFILRENGVDRVLFSYYEDAIIDRDRVVYFGSPDKNQLCIYDLQTGEEQVIYEFRDGNLDLLTFSHNRVYGIWNSIEYLKSFLVYIDLEQQELNSCLEATKGTEYIVMNDKVYYVDQNGGKLVCLDYKFPNLPYYRGTAD